MRRAESALIEFYLSLQPKLVRDVHHPIHKNGSHRPVEVLLPSFYVLRINRVAKISCVQKAY